MSYTPTNILATVGLLNNSGFDLNYVNGVAGTYNAVALPAAFKSIIAAAKAMDIIYLSNVNAPFVATIGSTKLPGIIGSMPSTYSATLGVGTVADTLTAQAATIFPGGDISSFVQNFSKASGAASVTGDLFRAAKSLSEKSFSDLGNIKKYSDIGTAGLGSLSKISDTNLASLGAELEKMGQSFNLADITQGLKPLSNPVNFAINAINKGAGGIGGLEDKINAIDGLSVETLSTFEDNTFAQQKISTILNSITNPIDLKDFNATLSIDETIVGNNLGDLLDFSNKIPSLSNSVNKDTIAEISTALNFIPGGENINAFSDLGLMMNQFKDLPTTTNLDLRNTFLTAGELNSIKGFIPIFDNDDVGPTTADLIGAVGGGPAATALQSAVTGATDAAGTSQGVAIQSLLDDLLLDFQTDPADDYTANSFPTSGRTLPEYKTLIESEMSNLMASSNAFDQSIVSSTGTVFADAAKQLSNQVTSITRMNIDLTQVTTGAKMSLISFGRSIGDLARDPINEAILLNMCSNNVYGEALKLHITEKKNIGIFQKFNCAPNNTISIPKINPDDIVY